MSRFAEVEEQRAVLDLLDEDAQSAIHRLTAVASRPGLGEEHRAVVALLLAHALSMSGDASAGARSLANAWPLVAGEDARYLTTILDFLLEGTTENLDTEPVLAARLLGLVQAHRGPFLLSPLHDPEQLLATLRDRLGDATVNAILAETATQPLPEDPDWDAVLATLRGTSGK